MTDQPEGGKAFVEEIMRREAAAARAAADARARPVARARRGRTLALVLAPVLIALTAWNAFRLARPEAVVTTSEETGAARFTVYLVASGLEAFLAEHGTLPPDLSAIGAEDDGVEYSRTEAGYALRVAVADSVFTYRSGESLEPFRQGYASLQREGAR